MADTQSESIPRAGFAHERRIHRVRHDTRRRTLSVERVERLTPHMVRIIFSSDDLDGFTSLSFDDHVKLFFPAADGGADQMRDYTPRRFDVAGGRLTIDFAVHDAGIATAWALAARVGDRLEIGGPRGSAIIPADFDWYWLVGDETALPAIGRWVEKAPAGQIVTTFVLVAEERDRQAFQSEAEWVGIWPVRAEGADDAALLRDAMAAQTFPAGDGFIWIAAEASVARALRGYVLDERRHPRQHVKAGGYWVRGRADAHDKLDD